MVCSAELHYPHMLSMQDSLSSMRDAQSIGFDDLQKRIEDLQEGLSAVRAEADEAAKAPSSMSGSRQCSLALMSPSPVAMTMAADPDGPMNTVSPRIGPIAPGFSRSNSAACRAAPSRSPLGSNSGITASTELRAPETVDMQKPGSVVGASALPSTQPSAPAKDSTAAVGAADTAADTASAAVDADGVGMETPRAACTKENPLAPDVPNVGEEPTSVSFCNVKMLTATDLSPAPESQAQQQATQPPVIRNEQVVASQSRKPEKEQSETDSKSQPQQQASNSSNMPLWWKEEVAEPAAVPVTPPEEQNTPPLPTKDASAVDSKATATCTPASDTLTQQPSWIDVNGQASETLSVSPGSLPPVTFSPGPFPVGDSSPADAVLMYGGNPAKLNSLSPTPTPTAFTGDANETHAVPTVSGAHTEYHTPLPSMRGELSADSCAVRYPDTGTTCGETPAMVTFASTDHVQPNAKPLFPVASGVPTTPQADVAEDADSPAQAESRPTHAPPPPPPPLPPPPAVSAGPLKPAPPAPQACASPTSAPGLKLTQISTPLPPMSPCGGSALDNRSHSQPPPPFSPAASSCSDTAALTRTMSHQGCPRPVLMSPPAPRPPLLPRKCSPGSAVGGSSPPRPLAPPKKLPMAFFDANGVAMLRHDPSDKGSEKSSEHAAPEQLPNTAAAPKAAPDSPQPRPPTPTPPLPRFPRLPRLPNLRKKKSKQLSSESQNSPCPYSPGLDSGATTQQLQAPHQPKYFNIDSLNPRRKSSAKESSDETTNYSTEGGNATAHAPAHTHAPVSRESSCRSPLFGTQQSFPAEQLVQHRSLPGESSTTSYAPSPSPLATRHSLPGDPSTESLVEAHHTFQGYSVNSSPFAKLSPATVCPVSPQIIPEASKTSDTAANSIGASSVKHESSSQSTGLSVVSKQPTSSATAFPSAPPCISIDQPEADIAPEQHSTEEYNVSESEDMKQEQIKGSGAPCSAPNPPAPAQATSFGSAVASVMRGMHVSTLLPYDATTPPTADGDRTQATETDADLATTRTALITAADDEKSAATIRHSSEDCASKGSAELRTAENSQSSASLEGAQPGSPDPSDTNPSSVGEGEMSGSTTAPAASATINVAVAVETQGSSSGIFTAETTNDSTPAGCHVQQALFSASNGIADMDNTQASSACTRRSSMSSLHPLSGVSDAIRTCYSDDCSSTPSPFVSGMLGTIQRVVSAGADSAVGSVDSPGSPLRACRACIGPMDSVLDFGQSRPAATADDIIAHGSTVSLAASSKGPFDGERTLRGGMQDDAQPTDDVQVSQSGIATESQAGASTAAADVPTREKTPPPVDTNESEKSPRLHRKALRGVHSEASEGEASGAFGELTLTVPSPLGSGSQIALVAGQTPASEQISEALQGLKDQLALDTAVSTKSSLGGVTPSDAQVPDLAHTSSSTQQQSTEAAAGNTADTEGVATKAPPKDREPRLSIEVPEKAGDACRDTAALDLSPLAAGAAHCAAEPDLSLAGAALGAPQSPFFDRSPWGGSLGDSQEGAGDLRDFSGLHRGQRTPSQAADSDALRVFLQGAEAEAAQAEERLRKAQARFKELMAFFSQPLHKELQVHSLHLFPPPLDTLLRWQLCSLRVRHVCQRLGLVH